MGGESPPPLFVAAHGCWSWLADCCEKTFRLLQGTSKTSTSVGECYSLSIAVEATVDVQHLGSGWLRYLSLNTVRFLGVVVRRRSSCFDPLTQN